MWFKTRAGLYSVIEPLEIRVAKYPKATTPSYSVFCRSLHDVDVLYKGIFGNFKAAGRHVHLAQFELSDSSEAEIAQCMRLIEEAIANESRICDLSAVGHADAWGDGWNLVEW
jgi:hypothetical protein